MKLPHITTKQEEILKLLYKYRFLNRIQIQVLLGHKDKRRVIAWLHDLRQKQYVEWIYSTDFTDKSKPAIYYISINGVRFLKTLENDAGTEYLYLPEEVRKRYKEKDRSKSFIDRSLLVADCCLTLEVVNKSCGDNNKPNNNSTSSNPTNSDGEAKTNTNVHYTYVTESDYIDPDHGYHFLAEHETLRPNLCIVKTERKNNRKTTSNYLLEIFDSTLPDYRLRYRLKAYVKYLVEGDWEAETEDSNPPTILLVYPRLADLINAKRRTRKLLLDEYYEAEDIPKNVHIRFTTTEQLQQHGITGPIWEEKRRLYGV
jgi:hypothetical protein